MKHKKDLGMVLFVGIGCVALLGLAVISRLAKAPEVVSEGAGIQMDDFTFYAGKAISVGRVGNVAAPAGKTFYLITAKLVNNAKRVDFDFHPERYAMAFPDGHFLRKAPDAQAEIDKDLRASQLMAVSVGPNGGSASSRIAFVGPEGLSQVRVAVEPSDGLAGTLETLFFGKKNFLLTVSPPDSKAPNKRAL